MSKTESSAVTEFINSVRREASGLPTHGSSQGATAGPNRIPEGTPGPEWLRPPQRPARGTMPPPIPTQKRQLQAVSLPPPIPTDARSEFQRPAVRAPSQLIVPAELEGEVIHDDTVPTPKVQIAESVARPAIPAAEVDAAIGAVESDWFDSGDAITPDPSLDIDFGEDEAEERAGLDSMQLERPARRRVGLAIAGATVVLGGIATAAYIAFSGPQMNDSGVAAARVAQPAAATDDAETEAVPGAAASLESAVPAAPVAAAPEPMPATPPQQAGVVLRRAVFNSEPAGATVTLVMDGKPVVLGSSPVDAQLDPSKSYQVIFTMDGRETVLRTVAFSGAGEIAIDAALTEAGSEPTAEAIAEAATDEPATSADDEPEAEEPKKADKPRKRKVRRSERRARRSERSSRARSRRATRSSRSKSADMPRNAGILMINSKPPCDIYIDGKKTGMKTPQRSIALKPGKHTVKLVNKRYNISKAFRVKIAKGKKTRVIKDMTDRL